MIENMVEGNILGQMVVVSKESGLWLKEKVEGR